MELTFYDWKASLKVSPILSVINSHIQKKHFEYFDALRINTIYSSYYNDYSYSNILGIASRPFPYVKLVASLIPSIYGIQLYLDLLKNIPLIFVYLLKNLLNLPRYIAAV